MKRALVVGGGFAGLAAGVSLAHRGVEVTLLEARPRLGGRAYSFEDEETGSVVDNGQHAMMGCYLHTLAFLERIGARAKLFRQPNMRVEMAHPRLGGGSIAFAPLPSPAHAAVGILRYRLLSVHERLQALLGGLRLMWLQRHEPRRLVDSTVEEILVALGQSDHARASFWYPVAIATLNERPDRASAAPLAEVLKRAFFGSRSGSQFVLPKVGLSDLYAEDARNFIRSRGGRVELKTAVVNLETIGRRVTAVCLRDGTRIPSDAFICAVPPRALEQLLPEPLRATGELDSLRELGSSPIVSVHLWWDRPVLDGEFLGLLGTVTQFAFNRTRLLGGSNGNGSQAVSTVISAAHEIVDWPNERITATVRDDLRAVRPVARAARLLRSVVVKERQATISVTPAAERLRPSSRTSLENLFLAGDWANTGLPPTIESAVMSGEDAARLVLDTPVTSDRAASRRAA